jgi:hypothetical protein
MDKGFTDFYFCWLGWIGTEQVAFWTAVYEVSCTKKSCATRYSPEPLWLDGEPEKWFKGASCVATVIIQKVQGSFLLDCTYPLRFICEVALISYCHCSYKQNSNIKRIALISFYRYHGGKVRRNSLCNLNQQ